jgi:VWFA-related protein
MFTAPAFAQVEVRVEARPVSDPIEAYIKVTDGSGPVSGLTSADFRIFVDGEEVLIQPEDLTLPPGEGGEQHVSVVFVMDYSGSVQSTALETLQTAVKDFVNAMEVGDEAAIVKFNDTLGVTVVQEFLPIDGAGNPNNLLLEAAVDSDYSGTGTPLLDALLAAVNQFVTPPHNLPAGPKAIILVSDGGENQSDATESEVVALANEHSIPIFTIGVGDTGQPGRTELMEGLAGESGGIYYPPSPDDQHIAEAYASISELLSNEYLITFASSLTDCNSHELRVEVTGHAPAIVFFTRRTCDTEPDNFVNFASQTGVEPSATVTSNTQTIMGLSDGVPAHISVLQGSYSIGCNGTFTNDPGTIADGETVCVRHQAAANFGNSRTTTLTIGGIAGTFTSTTRQSGGGGGGGGGGAMGLLDLLLLCGLGVLLMGSRRAA